MIDRRAHRTRRPAAAGSRRSQRRRFVSGLLMQGRLAEVRQLAAEVPTTVSALVGCLSETDDLLRWRAVWVLGQVVADLAERDLDAARDQVRRQFWAMNDEGGGIAWHAPEALAEMLHHSAALAQEFTANLAALADTYPFQEGVLYGLARVAERRPDLVAPEAERLIHAADSLLPGKRAYAAVALGRVPCPDGRRVLERLSRDPAAVRVPDPGSGNLRKIRVCDLARAALATLDDQRPGSEARQAAGNP